MVQPGTVIKWHHQGFTLFWRWNQGRVLGLACGPVGPAVDVTP